MEVKRGKMREKNKKKRLLKALGLASNECVYAIFPMTKKKNAEN